MKRATMILAAALAAILSTAGPSDAKLRVVTTLTEIAALVREIGGDRVEVTALAHGNEDPHFLAAKPSHSRRMMEADLLVYDGLELEVGWLPLLIEGARNPRIRPGAAGDLDLSRFIQPLEVPSGGVDRSMGDIHPEGNPHYTVDPALYPDLARAVADRLNELDSEGASFYEARLAAFERRWTEELTEWKERLAPLEGIPVVTYHKQWEYFARTFGLLIVDQVEDKPGIPPTPRHIGELEQTIRRENVPWIFLSDLNDPGNTEKLAERAGCRVLRLPQAVDSRDGTDDLFSWFDELVRVLEEAEREARR
ncbi:MAG: zinc ABC transporter substrate-binding protein [Candidatus Latescibacterota bacterium]|nr:MAG: zinc ABC transporter substrate-binding protein [Candidatus Latescibacterota bacterium]